MLLLIVGCIWPSELMQCAKHALKFGSFGVNLSHFLSMGF
jgi:hypothetical protein